jgi:hypothetical protein
MRVIAMAYGGEPLDRVATGEGPGVVYVANPSTFSSTGIERNAGVGFPVRYVFVFDQELFDSLNRAWAAEDEAELDRLWHLAEPIQLPLADAGASLHEAV